MRRLPLLVAMTLVVVAMSACGGDPGQPTVSSEAPPPSETVAPSTPPAPTPTPSAGPMPELPAGVPTSYDEDVPSREVPSDALIPPGTEVSNRWMARTDGGEVIVVAYFKPSGDPFVQARGLVEWRRNEGADPPWTPVFGIAHAKDEGILGFEAVVGDATGDDSDDLLLQEATGGSGACGTWRVIDLAAATGRWTRSLCDARVDLHTDPTGIALYEAVYVPEDPHCCPSEFRTTVFVYREDRGFVKDSVQSTPA